MNLLRCQILGFGKLANLTLTFEPGLNLVFASNEGGKTTLQHFILGLLYGQLRPDVKNQRRLEAWTEAFKPWQASQYAGILWCELANGRQLEMHRRFGKEEDFFKIRTLTGEDITGEYEQQKNGEVLFAKAHLGMPKELFESVAVIRENKVAEINGESTIRDRIANLAQTGDEDLSVRQSLKRLDDSLKDIGSEQAPTKPYRQAQERIQELQEERKALLDRWEEYRQWVQERNHHSAQIFQLESELVHAQRRLISTRLKETAQTVELLEKMHVELHRLGLEIEGSKSVTNFPAQRMDELNRLVGARESLERRLGGVRSASKAALGRLRQAETERQDLARYANLEPEKITEWLVSFTGLSQQQERLEKTRASARDEIGRLKDELDRLGPAFGDEKVDWELKARAAAEAKIEASQRGVKVAGKLALKYTALASSRQDATRQGVLGVFVLGLGLALILFVPGILAQNLFLEVLSYLLGAAFTMWAMAFLVAAYRSRRSARRIELEIKDLQADEARFLGEAEGAEGDILPAMEISGFSGIADFLATAKQAQHLRQKLTDLQGRVLELEERSAQLSTEASEVYANLVRCFSAVGLQCSLENLEAQVEALRGEIRRYGTLDSECANARLNYDSIRQEQTRLNQEHSQTISGIQGILAEAGVDSPEAFREAYRRYQLRLSHQEKEASLAREYSRLRGTQSLEDWRRRLQELKSQVREPAPESAFLPTVEEAEREEKRLALALASSREAYARLAERVSQAFKGHRSLSEIDEDLAWMERTFRNLSLNRQALSMAVKLLGDLSREQQEVLAPQLHRVVEQRFARLCEGRYPEVKIDLELHAWVRDTETGELRKAENLSRGTQDQLYFALRFGVLDLVSNGKEPCPCFLDEPFVAYDRSRLAEAFRILEEEATRRQLILFTCREDVRDLALASGAALVHLPQPNDS